MALILYLFCAAGDFVSLWDYKHWFRNQLLMYFSIHLPRGTLLKKWLCSFGSEVIIDCIQLWKILWRVIQIIHQWATFMCGNFWQTFTVNLFKKLGGLRGPPVICVYIVCVRTLCQITSLIIKNKIYRNKRTKNKRINDKKKHANKN